MILKVSCWFCCLAMLVSQNSFSAESLEAWKVAEKYLSELGAGNFKAIAGLISVEDLKGFREKIERSYEERKKKNPELKFVLEVNEGSTIKSIPEDQFFEQVISASAKNFEKTRGGKFETRNIPAPELVGFIKESKTDAFVLYKERSEQERAEIRILTLKHDGISWRISISEWDWFVFSLNYLIFPKTVPRREK